MTPSDKLREIVEKTFPLFGSRLDEWRKVERDRLLSDLTALIIENYVSKEEVDKMVEERWINVKDRLPRKDGKSSIYCLVNSEYDGIVVRPYNEYHKCWDAEDADDYYCDAVGGKITHWMPLPNPPIK